MKPNSVLINTPEFKEWFGNSKVRNGRTKEPEIAYHGTSVDISKFEPQDRPNNHGHHGAAFGPGYYFTSHPARAKPYAGSKMGSNILPVYLSIQNPAYFDSEGLYFRAAGIPHKYFGHDEERAAFTAKLKAEGHDGIIINRTELPGGSLEYIVFKPNQIKSALNSGSFSDSDHISEAKDKLELPDIEVGDEVLVGKFKNRKATVNGFTTDQNNQPVLKTDKGDQKLFKPRITKLMQEAAGALQPTPDIIAKAQAFVFEKWKERAAERGLPTPTDLSGSCKFSSLFAQALFGGKVAGNYDHQHLDLNGQIIDLNVDAADVDALKNPYANDPKFLRNPDFKESLNSCKPRVAKWVKEFRAKLKDEADA